MRSREDLDAEFKGDFTTYHCRAPARPHQRYMPHVVYQFIDSNGDRLYIGTSMNFDNRLLSHKSKDWWGDVAKTRIRTLPDKRRALDVERELIYLHQPKYNKGHALKSPIIKGLLEIPSVFELRRPQH